MKILLGVILLAAAYSALACGVEPQGNKTATPTADTTSLAAAATGTPVAVGTPPSTPSGATPVDAVEIPSDQIGDEPAADDESGPWHTFIIQSVRVELPYSTRWRIQFALDPCFGDLRRYLIVQDKQSGDRLKVDMFNKTVTVAAGSPQPTLASVVRRIQTSLSGIRALPPDLAKAPLLPTSSACDPSVAVPTLVGN